MIPVGNQDFETALAEVAKAPPLRLLRELIERLAIPADAKALLLDLAKITVRVGKVVLHVGRKIIDFAFEVVRAFPNSVFGAVMGLIVAALAGLTPGLGLILGPILLPLLAAFGLGLGAIDDMKGTGLRLRIGDLERTFSAILTRD